MKNMVSRFGSIQPAQGGDHSSSNLVNKLKVLYTECMSTSYATVNCSRIVQYGVSLECALFECFFCK